MNKLFVYGTLRNGMLQQVMPDMSPFIHVDTKGFVRGKLFDTGEFPAAKPVRVEDAKIYGEVIEIDPVNINKVLAQLDEYEEIDKKHPDKSLFTRKTVEVNVTGGKKIRAWIYWYNKDVKGLKEIKNGIYRKRKIAVN
jgi:gamma-glutamylcyclotransferase (GGCT)/AIG2-like uncharacterized protein YtfP